MATAIFLSSESNSSKPFFLPFVNGLSIIPVKETPNKRSSSQFCSHLLLRYLKLVSVDWKVPKIVALITFSFNVSKVSFGRITTSDKLQNSSDLKIISLQGLVPKL